MDAEQRDNAFGAAGWPRRLLTVDTRTAAVIGAAIVLLFGVPLAAALNIWVDEAFTLHTTGAGPLVAWTRAIAFEAQPPLFFFIEAAWRTWDEASIAFARLPSVLFAALAVAVIVFAAHRIAPHVPPLAAAFVTGLNPLVIWAAVEMRVYALVFLVGTVLTWTFYEGFAVSQPSRGARVWYVVFAIAGLYTQYYVGLLLVAQAITLLALRRAAIRPFAVAMVIAGAAFAPFVRIAMMDAQASGEFVEHATFIHAVHEIADAVFVIVLPHDVWSGAAKVAGFGLAAALVLGLSVFARPAVPRGPERAVVVAWLVCLAIFSLLFSVAGVPAGAPLKYLIVVAPSSLLVAFLFMSSLRRIPAIAGSIAIIAYGAYTFTDLWTQYKPPLMKFGDWQRVAATVSAGNPSTPIGVFPAELAQPLRWYLPAAIVEIPRPMRFTVDYVHESTLRDESQVSRVLDPVYARSEQLWMVTIDGCRESKLSLYDYHCRYLEAYLNRRYRVVKSVAFRGALARLYVRYPNVPADRKMGRNAN